MISYFIANRFTKGIYDALMDTNGTPHLQKVRKYDWGGWLFGLLDCWLICKLAGWLVVRLFVWLVGWLAGWLVA